MQASLSAVSVANRPSAAVFPMTAPSASRVASAELLKGNKAVEITHNGSVYRLQATKLGKLILTK